MLDIAHWAIRDLKVDQVTAIARRGPADVKFTKKEMEIVAKNLDLEAIEAEFERTGPVMEAVGQDAGKAKDFILSALGRAQEAISETRFSFDFLASPVRILGDDQRRVTAIEVEDTTLQFRDGGGTKAVGLGKLRQIEADTVIFCIGDKVDQNLGLPLDRWGDFAKAAESKYSVDGMTFEAYDPATGETIDGIFLAGWAREASSGLVGAARKDGTRGAKACLSYLEDKNDLSGEGAEALALWSKGEARPVVRKKDWQRLEIVEAERAKEAGLDFYKFSTNESMLEAMSLEREREEV